VIVEEQWPFASVSSEITYRIQKEGSINLDAPIRRICQSDPLLHYAPKPCCAGHTRCGKNSEAGEGVMYTRNKLISLIYSSLMETLGFFL